MKNWRSWLASVTNRGNTSSSESSGAMRPPCSATRASCARVTACLKAGNSNSTAERWSSMSKAALCGWTAITVPSSRRSMFHVLKIFHPATEVSNDGPMNSMASVPTMAFMSSKFSMSTPPTMRAVSQRPFRSSYVRFSPSWWVKVMRDLHSQGGWAGSQNVCIHA